MIKHTFQNKSKMIDLQELCTLLFNLACQSCSIVNQYAEQDCYEQKSIDNFVTIVILLVAQTDFFIQQFCFKVIQQTYGKSIAIVGEQNLDTNKRPEFKQIIKKRLSQIEYKQQIKSFSNDIKIDQMFPSSELSIWIDPIDCTKGLLDKKIQNNINKKYQVTILIGVAFQGKAIAGIIGHPFQKNQESSNSDWIYKPTVYFGSIFNYKQCAVSYNIINENWALIEKQKDHSTSISKRAVVGYRFSKENEYILNRINLTYISAGGAGNKILKIILGEVYSVFLIGSLTSKWDTCAGQAIIKAMGGFAIEQTMNEIKYFPFSNYKVNGFFMTLSKQVFEKFQKIIVQA